MTLSGSLQVLEDHSVLTFDRHLNPPVERVWRALTESEDLKMWFPATIEGDYAPGAKLKFVFVEHEGEDTFGEVLVYEPQSLFEYTWEADTLRFELTPEASGCHLHFIHTFPDKPGAAAFAAGWEVCFAEMDEKVFGDEAARLSPAEWPKLQDAYIAKFRLAYGSLETTGSGWTVRFERQLLKSECEVWEFLTEGSAPEIGGKPPLRFTNGYIEPGWVTKVEAAKLLKYEWISEGETIGKVQWEFSSGPGGARLVLTQTIPSEMAEKRALVLAAWHTHIELLAGFLRGEERCWPEGRTEELEHEYAELIQ